MMTQYTRSQLSLSPGEGEPDQLCHSTAKYTLSTGNNQQTLIALQLVSIFQLPLQLFTILVQTDYITNISILSDIYCDVRWTAKLHPFLISTVFHVPYRHKKETFQTEMLLWELHKPLAHNIPQTVEGLCNTLILVLAHKGLDVLNNDAKW